MVMAVTPGHDPYFVGGGGRLNLEAIFNLAVINALGLC